MLIIGLTGSIASGKNFVAEVFAKNGAAVFDADCEVHNLFELDKSTFQEISKNFPKAIIDDKINRQILGQIVFANHDKLLILEKILHPKVRKNFAEFLKNAKKNKAKIAVLNIPLLLEKEGYECDKIISVTVPKSLQKRRFISRAKKNSVQDLKILEKKFEQIYQKQLSNSERKKRSDFIIRNHRSKADTISQVKKIISKLT